MNENYTTIHQAILAKRNRVKRLGSSDTAPFVLSVFGWKGSGKSSTIDTIAQALKNTDRMQTIAAGFGSKDRDGTCESYLYNIVDNHFYIADFPGFSLNYINKDFEKADTTQPIQEFYQHLLASGELCIKGGLPSGVLPRIHPTYRQRQLCLCLTHANVL